MDNETLLGQINQARTASAVMGFLVPVFGEVEQNLLDSLKSNFRAGTYSELLLACHVAQLCAIDDLKTKIKGLIVRGDGAMEQLSKDDDRP